MAHDIRNNDSAARVAARTTIDENLVKIGDYLRDLVHAVAGTDELRLEAETDRILAAFRAGLAQPGARITVTVLDPSNNGTGMAAPLVLGPGSNPGPLAPAPTASIDEELGRKLRALTSETDMALDIVERVMHLGVIDADEVTDCISAFRPARGSRQYHDLIAFTGELAESIGRGGETIRTVPSGSSGATRKVLVSQITANGAAQAIQSQMDDITAKIFGGRNPRFVDTNDQVKQSKDRVTDLLSAETAFETELATHTGVSRNHGETIQAYVQRTLTGRRITGSDLDTLGDAIGIKRGGKPDDVYRQHMIDEIEKERQTANDYRRANNLAVVGNWTIGRLYTDLLDQKSGGFLGGGGKATIKFPVVNP